VIAPAAMFILSIAAMMRGIATTVPPAIVMAAESTLVRTGTAAVGPLAVSPLARV
jgi:hypothetical protein